ncbi:hypothetical protein SDJN03_28937, partial [Cucurbita argyrosperma subsp. sororia]
MLSHEEVGDEEFSEGEEEGKDVNADLELSEDDENGDIQPGIAKFTEGCRAFRAALRSILKKSISDETLGPILSANKKLVAEKLAEEEAERKVKRRGQERETNGGRKRPCETCYLDSNEKFLIGVATKGVISMCIAACRLSVVKLFNAVNKAQHAQKGLNPSRAKDVKGKKLSFLCWARQFCQQQTVMQSTHQVVQWTPKDPLGLHCVIIIC